MAFGSGVWNVGILNDNITILAGVSYCIPVHSGAFRGTDANYYKQLSSQAIPA